MEFTGESRGLVFRETENRNSGLVLQVLTVIHVLVNVLFALAATYLLSEYHGKIHKVKGKKYQVTASLYWALVLMCFVGAMAMIAGNCYLYYALKFDSSSPILLFRFTNDSVTIVLVIIELFASFCSPIDPDFFIPYLIRRALFCNLCCRCCGSKVGSRRLQFTILSIAMWIIILFLQLLLSSLLPVAVVTVGNPVPSLALISVLCALFFCMVVFLAYFINAFEGYYIANHRIDKNMRRESVMKFKTLQRNPALIGDWVKNKLVLIAQAFIFLVIFAIVALIVLIFLNFVKAGANTNSVGGLFFSVFPSVVLGGLTWAAKKHLFKEFEDEDEEDDNEDEASQHQETVFKLGGLSFRKSRHQKRKTPVKENNQPDTTIVNIEAPNTDSELSAEEEGSGLSLKDENVNEDRTANKENVSAGGEETGTLPECTGDTTMNESILQTDGLNSMSTHSFYHADELSNTSTLVEPDEDFTRDDTKNSA